MTAVEFIEEIERVLDRDVRVEQWASGNNRTFKDPDLTLREIDRIVEKFRVYGDRS